MVLDFVDHSFVLLSTCSNRVEHLFITVSKGLVAKSDSNFFQGVAGRLNIVEVYQSSREEAEGCDDQVEVSTNPSECIGRHHANNEVENPVARRCCINISDTIFVPVCGKSYQAPCPCCDHAEGRLRPAPARGLDPT